MKCKRCNSEMLKNGKTREGYQKYICPKCRHNHEDRTPEPAHEKQIGISESQLRAKHDNHFIIEKKCKEMRAGIYLTHAEFITFCGIRPGSGYRGIIEHPDYDKYHGRAGAVVYWSHPDSIKKLKDEGVLS